MACKILNWFEDGTIYYNAFVFVITLIILIVIGVKYNELFEETSYLKMFTISTGCILFGTFSLIGKRSNIPCLVFSLCCCVFILCCCAFAAHSLYFESFKRVMTETTKPNYKSILFHKFGNMKLKRVRTIYGSNETVMAMLYNKKIEYICPSKKCNYTTKLTNKFTSDHDINVVYSILWFYFAISVISGIMLTVTNIWRIVYICSHNKKNPITITCKNDNDNEDSQDAILSNCRNKIFSINPLTRYVYEL